MLTHVLEYILLWIWNHRKMISKLQKLFYNYGPEPQKLPSHHLANQNCIPIHTLVLYKFIKLAISLIRPFFAFTESCWDIAYTQR